MVFADLGVKRVPGRLKAVDSCRHITAIDVEVLWPKAGCDCAPTDRRIRIHEFNEMESDYSIQKIPAYPQVKSRIAPSQCGPRGQCQFSPDPVDQTEIQITILNIGDILVRISDFNFRTF